MQLLDWLKHNADTFGGDIAWQTANTSTCWHELYWLVQSTPLPNAPTGCCIGIIAQQNCEYIAMLLAGLPHFKWLILAPKMAETERARALKSCQASGYLDAEFNYHPLSSKTSNCKKTGILLPSSGTTGLPKLVFREYDSLTNVAIAIAKGIGLQKHDRILGCVPLSHSYGMEHSLLAPLVTGCTTYLEDTFNPAVIGQTISEQQISVLPGVPVIFDMLLHMWRKKLPSLRLAYSAGAPLPRETWDACLQELDIAIGQLYGTTEVGSIAYLNPHLAKDAPCCQGVGLAGVELRVLDADKPIWSKPLPEGNTGEIACNSPWAMIKYIGSDPMDRPFLTGDLGHIDANGYLHITGRKKLLIDAGGSKVNPLEVEYFLQQIPGVKQCVVLPDPVSPSLSRIEARMVWETDTEPLSAKSVREYLKQHLSPHKIPRNIVCVDSLPTSSTGKILRGQLLSHH